MPEAVALRSVGGLGVAPPPPAPLVCVKPPGETAAAFIRQEFRRCRYPAAGPAAVLPLGLAPAPTAVMAALAVGRWPARQMPMPAIERDRNRRLDGDARRGRRFDDPHRSSVMSNPSQTPPCAKGLAPSGG